MGVSNVQNSAQANAIAAIKKNLAAKGKTATQKPSYMQMTGSIFDAPQLKNTNQLADLNTTRSLKELNKKPDNGTVADNKDNSKGNFSNIDNASDGKAAAAQMEQQKSDVENQTRLTEQNTKTVQGFEASAQKLDKQIAKDDKKFEKTLQKEQAAFKKETADLQKAIKENEETAKEIDDAQNELDSLLASNSFSVGDGNSNPNGEKINELKTLIGSKVGMMQANGKTIYSLQRSQSRTLVRMNKTNTNYVKAQKNNINAIQKQETTTDKIVKTATEIEQWSALVEQGGKALNLAGKGLVALGSAMTFGGAALITTGTIMSKIGVVAEMAGQYGQAAANITKTAAYAADGNLAGAMQSASAAYQSGAAAVKSTKGLGKSLEAINKDAQEAKNTLTAKMAAKDAVKDMDANQLGGMSKKEMKKSIEGNLKTELTDGNIDAKELRKQVRSGNLSDKNFNAIDNAVDSSRTSFQEAVTQKGGSIKDGVVGGLDKKARKEIRKSAQNGFKNVPTKTVAKSSTSWANKLEGIGKGLSSAAAMFAQQQNPNQIGSNYKTVPQWDLQNDARFQRIARSNRAHLAHASYV